MMIVLSSGIVAKYTSALTISSCHLGQIMPRERIFTAILNVQNTMITYSDSLVCTHSFGILKRTEIIIIRISACPHNITR